MNKPVIDTRQEVQPVVIWRHGMGAYAGQALIAFEFNNSGLIHGMTPAQTVEFAKALMHAAGVATGRTDTI